MSKQPTTELVQAQAQLDMARVASITGGLRLEGERVQGLAIDDDTEEAEAGARLRDVKLLDMGLAQLIAATKRPFLDVTQHIDRLTKPGRDDIAFLICALTGVIGTYNIKKLEARREATAQAQAEARARNTHGVTLALNAKQDAAPQKLEGIGVKLKWHATVVDPEAVPRQWCTPDEKAIQAHARGFRENDTPAPIAGVEFQLVGGSSLR